MDGPSTGSAPARWRRLDLLKVFCLLVAPLFLLVSYWAPIHGRYPTREELRDTLRELDDAAYAQSGCDAVAQVLARCEKFRVECPSQYYFELRSINRNCHALRCAPRRPLLPTRRSLPVNTHRPWRPHPRVPRSTKELETCLLETPGGKCVFEMVASWCGEGVTEVLACHKLSMTQLLEKVLSPPFDSSRSGAGARAADAAAAVAATPAPASASPSPEPPALSQRHEEWRGALRAAASAATLAAAQAQELRLISWALPAPPLGEEEEEGGQQVDARVDYQDLAGAGAGGSSPPSNATSSVA